MKDINKAHSYEIQMSNIQPRQIIQLGFSEADALVIQKYRSQFSLMADVIDDADTIMVALRDLWVMLGCPYLGDWEQNESEAFFPRTQLNDKRPQEAYREWKRRVAIPFLETNEFTFTESLCPVYRSKGRVDTIITVEAAKHLAMAAKGNTGKIARSYFLLTERVLKASLEYSSERINLHKLDNQLINGLMKDKPDGTKGLTLKAATLRCEYVRSLTKFFFGATRGMTTKADINVYSAIHRNVSTVTSMGLDDESLFRYYGKTFDEYLKRDEGSYESFVPLDADF